MKPPAVYKAIAAVTAALSRAGIAKDRTNEQEGWAFRGIDDVYNALSPLLARHKLCILPRILERDVQHRRQGQGDSVCHVALKVEFAFVSAVDGSSHSVEIWGEGTDRADKATNKAMASAYKYAAFQVFCIPVAGQVDGDAETIKLGAGVAGPTNRNTVLEPVQGWAQWAADICDMVKGCQTEEAVYRLQTTYRKELHTLSATDAAQYKLIGEAVAALRQRLAKPDGAAISKAITAPRPPAHAAASPPASDEQMPEMSARELVHAAAAA